MLIATLAADIPGIDAVLRERLRRFGISREKQMAVVVEITNERHVAAPVTHATNELRHCCRSVFVIDRHPNQLGPRFSQRDNLLRSGGGISRIGIGHRLDDDGMGAPNGDVTDVGGYCVPTSAIGHDFKINWSPSPAGSLWSFQKWMQSS